MPSFRGKSGGCISAACVRSLKKAESLCSAALAEMEVIISLAIGENSTILYDLSFECVGCYFDNLNTGNWLACNSSVFVINLMIQQCFLL